MPARRDKRRVGRARRLILMRSDEKMKKHLFVSIFVSLFLLAFAAHGGEPGWERGAIRLGADRQKIRNTHILHRPYRPLHVYGNTVRRLHYHGQLLPSRRNVSRPNRR